MYVRPGKKLLLFDFAVNNPINLSRRDRLLYDKWKFHQVDRRIRKVQSSVSSSYWAIMASREVAVLIIARNLAPQDASNTEID